MKPLARQLREAREAAGLSLRQAATPSGLSPAAVSMIETEPRSPSLRSVQALAKVLRLDVVVSPRGVTVKGRRAA